MIQLEIKKNKYKSLKEMLRSKFEVNILDFLVGALILLQNVYQKGHTCICNRINFEYFTTSTFLFFFTLTATKLICDHNLKQTNIFLIENSGHVK